MNRLLALLLAAAVAGQSLAAERTPGKRRNKKRAAAEQVEQRPDTARTIRPEPVKPADPQPAEPVASRRLPDDMTLGLSSEQADSLVAVWRERQSSTRYEEFFERYILPDTLHCDTIPDSLYRQRLINLVSPVQLPYNDVVRTYIQRYTSTRYGTIERILALVPYYFPLIEEELLRADLPVELRALPIIESALSPTAGSRAGAVGLWQFMPATAKSYGLEVNSLVDERRDPIRSTQAACRFLKDLYAIYNDWTLAIAAYNCGPGNVNKAIARSGGKTFWEIYDYLPRETRGYVPAFIGATYACAYHRQHGIEADETPIPLSVDTVHVNRLTHLNQIAETIDLPIETLRQLNPQYKLDIIPATTRPYTLVLPQRHVARYIAGEESMHSTDSVYLKEYLAPGNLDRKRQTGTGGTYYRIKSGDTLGAIARRYRVTTQQLMRWNNIRDPKKLRIGQRIRIEGRS